jgi:hypothetical protein
MIRLLILLSCYASVWSNAPTVGGVLQASFFGLFLVGSLYAISRKRVIGISPSSAEIVLYAATALSAIVGLLRAADFTMQYSMLFLTALILISIMTRAVSLEQLLDIGAVASLLAVLTCLLVERHSLFKALSISMGRNGLFRFTPLHTHADLTGLIFGSYSILMARRALIARRHTERAMMIMGVVLAWTIVLAASARASLLALVVAGVGALVLEIRPAKATYLKLAGLGAAAICVMFLLSASRMLSYLQGMLEFNSKHRGVASGGSGRTEIWSQGISLIFADPVRLVFGGGLRSSELSSFASGTTENSYISILLDSGLFAGTTIICIYIYSAIKALRLSRSISWRSNSLIFLFTYFVFLLVESFFNRYLLAIGNSASLLALMILISLSIREVPVEKLTTAAEYSGATERAHTHPKALS